MNMFEALAKSGLVSDEVVAERARQDQLVTRREIVRGVTFKSSFDLMSLLEGISGRADCRVYVDSYQDLVSAETRVRDFLRNNPQLGSIDASIRDIDSIERVEDGGRMWVAVHCRNAHTAWDVTGALRSIANWAPAKVGRITCPKVEQLLRDKGISM